MILSALQMGWSKSPAFFCAASETARDVAEARCQDLVGALPAHKLEDFLFPPGKWEEATIPEQRSNLFKLLEVYIGNFCALSQTTKVEELLHIT